MTNMWSQSIILKEILGLVSGDTSSLKSGISFIINFVHWSFHPMWTVLPWWTVCEDSGNVQVSLASTGTTEHEDHNHPNNKPAHFANNNDIRQSSKICHTEIAYAPSGSDILQITSLVYGVVGLAFDSNGPSCYTFLVMWNNCPFLIFSVSLKTCLFRIQLLPSKNP
jgi:hypothetical protein